MKIYNIFKSVLLFVFITTFVSCVKSDLSVASGSPEIKTYQLTKTVSVATVNALATVTPKVYTTDDIIEAYVTSNDAAGNFYKSISFQDVQTADGTPIGFSVNADQTMLFQRGFFPGRKVYIALKGLAIANVYGSMQIGLVDPTDPTKLTGISGTVLANYLFPSSIIVEESKLLRHMSLSAAASNAVQNTLIEVDNVQFAKTSLGRTYFDINDGGYATNQTIEDPYSGTQNVCRISQYAPFSVNKIPSGKGSILGVMTKYSSTYQFTVRSESDFKLTGPRIIPILDEEFTNGIGAWYTYSVTGAQVWTYSSSYGNPGSMVKISGYSGGNQNNEDWLISPSVDLSTLTSATLSLDNAYKFTGPAIEILVSNNYPGTGSPLAAGVSWTTLTGANLSTGNYAYANTGPLDISLFTGSANTNVHVAIKYTSTTSAASTWEVDNVKIIGN